MLGVVFFDDELTVRIAVK